MDENYDLPPLMLESRTFPMPQWILQGQANAKEDSAEIKAQVEHEKKKDLIGFERQRGFAGFTKVSSEADFKKQFTDIVKLPTKGAFGTIYTAKDNGRKGKIVALKMLREMDERARNETDLLIELSKTCHPNVLCYLDFFRTYYDGNPQYVIETELIQGENLAVVSKTLLLSSEYVPATLACQVTSGLLKGLTFLHAKGIYHQDIKPENVVLRRDNVNTVVPVIIDFGLSCRSSDLKCMKGEKTAGTATYFSPGRWACVENTEECNSVEKRQGDIWALAVTLFVAFAQQGAQFKEYFSTVMSKLSMRFTPPSGKELLEAASKEVKLFTSGKMSTTFYPPFKSFLTMPNLYPPNVAVGTVIAEILARFSDPSFPLNSPKSEASDFLALFNWLKSCK